VQESVKVVPFNSAEAVDAALIQHEGQIAAVIMEPYQRGIPPDPGYLEAVRRAASDAGALLIFDEVVTGFRLAYGGAQEHYGVVPDLCTLGKILGGGFPLGAVCGPRRLMRLADMDHRGSDAIFWNGTFYGNPVAAAAGRATLEELRRPGVYERLFAVGERMRSGLARVLVRHDIPGRVLGDGPMFYLDADHDLQRRIGAEMVRRGYLWIAGNRSYLSTAHTDDQIDATLADAEDVMTSLRADVSH
jgi:glutamate-1-semialdehyde 2,1-aminomutase